MKYQALSNNVDGLDDKSRVPKKSSDKKYFLDLKKGENLTQQHYRIKRGDTVVFRQCASLYGCDVKLFSEVPPDGEAYVRGKYQPVAGESVTPPLPGSFHYYFTTDGSDENIDGEGYIIVEPLLKIGDEHLPLDCIQCITYLSKCLGPLSTWREKLAVARETGYNMIHFTPIQRNVVVITFCGDLKEEKAFLINCLILWLDYTYPSEDVERLIGDWRKNPPPELLKNLFFSPSNEPGIRLCPKLWLMKNRNDKFGVLLMDCSTSATDSYRTLSLLGAVCAQISSVLVYVAKQMDQEVDNRFQQFMNVAIAVSSLGGLEGEKLIQRVIFVVTDSAKEWGESVGRKQLERFLSMTCEASKLLYKEFHFERLVNDIECVYMPKSGVEHLLGEIEFPKLINIVSEDFKTALGILAHRIIGQNNLAENKMSKSCKPTEMLNYLLAGVVRSVNIFMELRDSGSMDPLLLTSARRIVEDEKHLIAAGKIYIEQMREHLTLNPGFREWDELTLKHNEFVSATMECLKTQISGELGGSKSAYSLRDQLKVNSSFSEDGNSSPDIKDVAAITNELRSQWNMLSICDIVLNHTANESKWLVEHPECAYNLQNSPHLRPAYVLDRLLYQFSLDVALGNFEISGIPIAVNCEDHLNAMRYQLGTFLIPKARIPDMFLVDVQKYVQQFKDTISHAEPNKRSENISEADLKIIQDPEYRYLESTIDMELAVQIYNVFRSDCYDEDTRQKKCTESFKSQLDALNSDIKNTIEDHLRNAVENCVATVRYFRIDPNGPKILLVTKKDLLVPRYFEELKGYNEDDVFTDNSKYIAAHNGWVMNYDPLKDFAELGSNVYLRRELIAWGDSVKLRYGKNKKDCPYLWEHMKKYVETTARVFDGVRLDNCHSTPIHVAQYLLDAARVINPNLFIVAELFTNSDLTDNVFINKLGITSLIREAMSGWDSHEVGRLVYRYGGSVIGAMGVEKASRMAHALFMDITHDNPSPVEKRTVYDLLPTAALVSMASCASGSTAGYDQLVPHHIHVVDESRTYMSLEETETCVGIMKAKLALNKLHCFLAKEGFNQVFVDQIDQDIVCVTRQNPVTLDSVVLFSYTAFHWPDDGMCGSGKGVTASGLAHSVLLEAHQNHKSGIRFVHPNLKEFSKNPEVINGLSDYVVTVRENLTLQESDMVQAVPYGTSTRLNLTASFKPGSIVAVKITSRLSAKEAAGKIIAGQSYEKAISKLDFLDLNYALYRHHTEEDEGGPYNIPGYGLLTYCGLQGAMSVLEEIARNDDLGHPLCGNLRDGLWLPNYIVQRFVKHPNLKSLGGILEKEIALIEDLPAALRPWGFYTIISRVYRSLIDHAVSLMPDTIKYGNEFAHRLSLCSIQMAGVVRSAPLPPLSEKVKPPKPKTEIGPDGKTRQLTVTLAAGLPHFSSGYMRSWGRDTFISLKGLMLLTHRFDEARYIILGYAACLRHGLIPNLLDAYGLKPRFNCRDAVWWWLYSIKEYVALAPNGAEILYDTVNRLFPKDDSDVTFVDQDLHTVMQEALNVHFQGLCFRERNAGTQIDEHMTNAGFDNQIGVHPTTGFVFGGNEWNCGTWMDKMGSSVEAGTKGRPATPRDGSAVEIVGLSMAVVSWLKDVHAKGLYPHEGVTRVNKDGSNTTWTWANWSAKIKDNFEKEFWVDVEAKGQFVNRRGIYKDSVGATQPWADFRLRPNFTIAMVVAPELFTKDKAQIALEGAKILLGPLGMKTLDPSDLAYCGDYDNSNQSADSRVAHGFNYHQGPEWLWPVGYYLMAKLQFSDNPESSKKEIKKYLARHWSHLETDFWRGLPELTNSNGAVCRDSCNTQAWSAATILETLIKLSPSSQNVSETPGSSRNVGKTSASSQNASSYSLHV